MFYRNNKKKIKEPYKKYTKIDTILKWIIYSISLLFYSLKELMLPTFVLPYQ